MGLYSQWQASAIPQAEGAGPVNEYEEQWFLEKSWHFFVSHFQLAAIACLQQARSHWDTPRLPWSAINGGRDRMTQEDSHRL